MATENTEQSRAERFTTWNPYAAEVARRHENDPVSTETMAQIAVAFEISQLRTEIHFAAKGRRS